MTFILSSVMAHAQTAADISNCKNEPIQRSQFVSPKSKIINYELCLETKKNARSVNTFNSELQALKVKEPTCFPDERGLWDRMMNKTLRSPTAVDLARCEKEVADKKKDEDRLDAQISKTQRELEIAQTNFNAQKDSATATATEREKINNIVEEGNFLVGTNFDTMKLSIFDAKLQAKDAEMTLTKMATALDNAAIGLYLRDRMAGLLNSDSFCNVAKQCPNHKAVKGTDLNSVFNSTMNTKVNADLEIESSAPGGQKAAPSNSSQ